MESYINNKESDKKHQYLFGHNLKIVMSLMLLGPGQEVLFWSFGTLYFFRHTNTDSNKDRRIVNESKW